MENEIKSVSDKINKEAGFRTTNINGKEYSVKLLPASLGFEIASNLIKIFLPVLGVLGDSSKREGFVLPEEESIFSEMALLLCSQLEKIDLLNIVQTILSEAKCNGQTFNFDLQFRANYSDLISLLEFALKENFGDFLSGYLSSKGLSIGSLNALLRKNQDNQDHTPQESKS